MKDYYELLEVNKNASDDTIKKVFRMLIKKNHPDLFEGKEKTKAEEKVKQLNEAYEIISDKEKRAKYDEELEQDRSSTDEAIETLIQENEYLKSVINEKNRLIKEYLEEIGIDTRNIEDGNSGYYEDESYIQDDSESNDMQYEMYGVYQVKNSMKNIAAMLLAIMVGIIVISIFTDVNLIGILIDIFKSIF